MTKDIQTMKSKNYNTGGEKIDKIDKIDKEIDEKVIRNNNNLNTNDIFRLADLYFYKKNYIFRHLHDSYNKFIDEDVKNFLENEEHIFAETMTYTTFFKYRFKYENIRIQEPMLDNGIEPLFPSSARHGNLTYSVKVFADVTQYQDIIDIASDEKKTIKNGNKEENVLVSIIPLMVRSKYCTLTANKGIDKNECDYDPGGYFLVKGNEKVIICQDRMIENKPLVFLKKDAGLYVQVNSKSYKDKGIVQPLIIRIKKDLELLIKVPILKEINVAILLKALGLESERNIINYTTYDEYDNDMVDVIRMTLDMCKTEKGTKISTQEDALDYLITKMKIVNKKINDVDKDIKHAQKKKFLLSLLMNNFLPHVDENSVSRLQNKAFYICYMINKLVRVHLGRIPIDDRDSYVNKRIDLPGDLIFELYKQHHKKMLGDCKKYFDQRNKSNDNPIVIINIIKPNIIEQGINAALSTGRWPRKQGVAQIVQRLSYLYTISLLRRIDAPGADSSTMKLTTPRHLHPSSTGFLCCVTGDTKILMADGSTKLIKDMQNGDIIRSVEKNTLREISTKIKNYFAKENQEIVEITLITGRKLRCTLDHPILCFNSGINTNNNTMIDAGDLEVGNLIIVRPYEHDEETTSFVEYEYSQYVKHQEKNNKLIMEYKKFEYKYGFLQHCQGQYQNNMLALPIESIVKLPAETVYDFTTILDTHTLIANGFVTSNCVETPEHAKIGLTKHLSMIGSVTIMSREQYYLISDYLLKRVIKIDDVPPEKLRNHNIYKVFLNGDWIGITEDPINFSDEMNQKRIEGYFDMKNTSIVRDDDEGEIKIYCDSGRLYRPVIKVEDNIVSLKKQHIEKISLNKNEKDKITSWDDFIVKFPNIIDYIDMENQPYVMIAHKMKKVEEMRLRMNESIKKIKDVKSNHVENRYDDMMYVKYNYCEFHPSLLIGEIVTNVPFCNMNQGVRNIFQYAQGRQAMTIYATNYRTRLDISYILYKPQRSLVHTRSSVYTNTRMLPPGENCLVAIGIYTGLKVSPCHSKSYGKSKCDRQRC
jgi:DNA-directed RNA polymerase beta subunit